jgi:hypothetical protein
MESETQRAIRDYPNFRKKREADYVQQAARRVVMDFTEPQHKSDFNAALLAFAVGATTALLQRELDSKRSTSHWQAEIMMRIASEFGFTPASRSRIATPSDSDELHNGWSQNGNKENFQSDRDMASSVAQPDSIAPLVAIEACVAPEKPRFTDDATIIAMTGSRTTK